jgi:hypothetical protein
MFLAIIRSAVIAMILGFASPALADLTWGVNGHPLMAYPGVSVERQLDYIKDLGMKSYRVDVPNTTKIPALRQLVIAAKKRGIEILPVVTPDFDLNALQPDVLQKKAYDLGFTLASEFKKDIRVWELANEFENYAILKPCEMRDNGVQYSCLFGSPGGVDPLDYYGPRWAKAIAVVKGLTAGVHAADPTILRAVGTAGWGHIGAFERMYSDGVSWDISVWHMYGEDPEWALKKLVKYGHPIWITEFNHPLGSTKSEQEQADGLAKAIAQLRRYQSAYNVQAAHIYELLDEPYWAPNYEAYMGLIRVDKIGETRVTTPKIAYQRVKELISSGATKAISARADSQSGNNESCLAGLPPPNPHPTAKEVIAYSYCLVLGRPADGAGLASWSARLTEGMPIANILAGMLQSDEFERSHGINALSAKDYVALIYRILLSKNPDAAVLEKTAGDIDSGRLTRANLQKTIIESAEFKLQHPILDSPLTLPPKVSAIPKRTCILPSLQPEETTRRAQIAYGYCLVLGRKPEIFGLNSYNAAMLKGLTIPQLLSELLSSDEFEKKYGLDSFDNASFVTLMYRLLLQRDPDGAGMKSYVENLDKGTLSRSGMWDAMIASDEFRNRHPALFISVAAASMDPSPDRQGASAQ